MADEYSDNEKECRKDSSSQDATAMKNHYLMVQTADMVRQLYEWFFLKKYEIKKKPKNISSELPASFGRQLTETKANTGGTK